VCLVTYTGWAFLPDSVLHYFGITYYPDRYWSISIPIYFGVFIIFIWIFYFAINLIDTAPLDSLDTIQDKYSKKEAEDDENDEAIPPFGDITIDEVNEKTRRL